MFSATVSLIALVLIAPWRRQRRRENVSARSRLVVCVYSQEITNA
jgi:hypothetical protein